MEKEEATEKAILHVLVPFPSGCNGWHWVRLKPGARNAILTAHVGSRGPCVGKPSFAFPRHRSRKVDEKWSDQDSRRS